MFGICTYVMNKEVEIHISNLGGLHYFGKVEGNMSEILSFDKFRLDLQDDDGNRFNLLDDISFSIQQGHAVGVVGESGCGKSMTSLSVMRLLPPVAKAAGGSINFCGEDLMKKTEQEMYKVRGKQISMVFQEPMTSLNPVLTIGFQIGEIIRRHEPKIGKAELRDRVIQLIERVGIPNPESRLKNYPHQFSGGMRQRAMIAMAIACSPQLLIADEPTTALDVTIQAQVLDLMVRLKQDGSMMLITHNLGVVAETCDEVVVMYAGQIVEKGTTEEVFLHPAHPYTMDLLKSIPTLETERGELFSIAGVVPMVKNFTKGCRFAPRCQYCTARCMEAAPQMTSINASHSIACYLNEGGKTV